MLCSILGSRALRSMRSMFELRLPRDKRRRLRGRVERRSEKVIWNMSGIIEIYHDESCEDSFESM